MELIPSIDLMEGRVVRLVRGDPQAPTVYSHDPVRTARRWEAAGADALHIVDLDATLGRQRDHRQTILDIIGQVNIPVQVGGGIRTPERAAEWLEAGARKVVIGTMAFHNRRALEMVLHRFGSERIMVAIDYATDRVMIKGWQEATALEPLKALGQLLHAGVRQFLMTSIARDGTLEGADLTTLRAAAQLQGARIYASGGVSSIDDLRRLDRAGVTGVIMGKALYEGRLTLDAARRVMAR